MTFVPKGAKVSIPALLSEDRTNVTTTDGKVWLYVKHLTKNIFYFTPKEKLKPDQRVFPLEEKLAVMENTATHIPIRCTKINLLKLIKNRGGSR
jgi:hypothetical protein